MKSNILHEFNVSNCCGCTSCINSCPTQALFQSKDEYGFIIPAIDENKCIHCGKCISACPYHTEILKNSPIKTYAAINLNEETVKNSSSGGVFSAIAESVLKNGGCVFGAMMDKDFQVKHIVVEDIENLYKLQKSKYVQSNLYDIYKKVKLKIEENRCVLFTGTPCQIAGLKAFLKNEEYENLICVDVVCHGVPNQDLYNDYIKSIEKKYGKIEKYTFRAKKNAKNGMNCYFSFKEKGKTEKIRNWPEDSFNFFYMNSMIYRDSCYSCKFAKKERGSDITLCDYWSWNLYHSTDFAPSSSVSGVVANTNKGLDLIKKSCDIKLVLSEYANLVKHNSCLTSPTPLNSQRKEILQSWKNEGYEKLDTEFIKTHKKQILKCRLMRQLPEKVRIFFTNKRQLGKNK